MHALKDYWGMVKLLEKFPSVHATFNVVPGLAAQLEEYATGSFDEPWFSLAFSPASALTSEDRGAILERAFQLNYDNLLRRWPRFVELHSWVQQWGRAGAIERFSLRDWRDLQFLSQLAWMDEDYLASDPIVSKLSHKGEDFTEGDKASLRLKQLDLLARVLPEYRAASDRGQIEISTTPFYHPILPLLCDTDVAREANQHTPLPRPAFCHPEDARAQLLRAREFHARLFGKPPVGLWPSEGSVSNAALTIAAELGFSWFATDEGVLGRTRGIGFARDSHGIPDNAESLYSPWRITLGPSGISGFYRDHHLSDLVGFVYSRMDAESAAEDLYRRVRRIGESWHGERPPTICLILDGENAWEYYPGCGRAFLRGFYNRIQIDSELRALTASEALAAAGDFPSIPGTAPGSWINANFDIWIGHPDDVRAWELLGQARDVYATAEAASAAAVSGAPDREHLARAFESVLAAEGSDWCWWYGPENSSANDADFDALYRQHLTGIYLALGQKAPSELGQPLRQLSERARSTVPGSLLAVAVDGRETSYFEWLGAGYYAPDRRGGAMHGSTHILGELRYGFSLDSLFLRVDPLTATWPPLLNCEFRIAIRTAQIFRVNIRINPSGAECISENVSLGAQACQAAFNKILEVAIPRAAVDLAACRSVGLSVALWQGGLPVDLLPAESYIEAALGEENFAWVITP
jgi:alpha-amylase/alpha-mannosidase (GH57 family)